ncbi:MAG: hypothetical protein ABI361_01380 [Nitrososphaera sp.]|jgi:hypothetical protein
MRRSSGYRVKTLRHSVKFYLPRVEGYLEVIRQMATQYSGMSLIEFDGFFEGKYEPVKYVRVEIHVNKINVAIMEKHANEIRLLLKQQSLAFEYDNRLVLVAERAHRGH